MCCLFFKSSEKIQLFLLPYTNRKDIAHKHLVENKFEKIQDNIFSQNIYIFYANIMENSMV